MTAPAQAPARIKRVVHTIHAVRDLDACRKRYQDLLGGLVFAEGYFEPEDRDMALLYVADHMVEPMAPRDPADLSKPYARYLAKHGEGWHSFELRIADCAEVAARLDADGYTLASNYGMFFYVRPESTGGILLEACDVPIPNDPYERRNWRPEWAEGMASTLLRLDHVACVVHDLEAARHLFTHYVDGEVLDEGRIESPQPARRVLMRLGDADVALIQPDDQTAGVLGEFTRPPTSGVYALMWAVEDLARAEAFFVEQGVRVTRDGCVSGGFAIDPADFAGARHEFVAARWSELEDLRAEVAALATRLRELEDRQEIAQLATRYGPAVDVGDSTAAAALWTEDGVYAAPPYAVWTGRAEIAGMVDGGHQDLIRAGAGHVLTPLHVELGGDEAWGWNHAMNVQWREAEGHFVVFRLSANEWHFRRGADGWRVASRVNRPLDGADEARELFRGSAEAGHG